MSNILVIDDDDELYAILTEYFAESEFQLERAIDAESALSRLAASPDAWDIVILDFMLPGMSGMKALELLRVSAKTSYLPVLMLTARGGEDEKVAGLEAGADDYLAKPFSLNELAARLRALLRRSAKNTAVHGAQPDQLCFGDMIVNRPAQTVEIDGRIIKLTSMEVRLLELLVPQYGKVISREMLCWELFSHLPQPQDRGLDMTVSRLRKKLGPKSDGGDRIQGVWGVGYKFLL